MNKVWSLLSALWSKLPKYAPIAAAVLAGLGSVAADRQNEGLQQILQAVAVLSGGAAVVHLHGLVSQDKS